MKELLTDALSKKVAAALTASGGVQALYGEPITVGDEQVVPVGRITVELSANADAEGSGGGKAGLPGLGKLTSGGGGGNAGAGAGIRIHVEPLGFLRSTQDGPVFVSL